MKKHYYILSIILIFCFAKASFGFVDQRYQYWQIQLNSLHEEKNKVMKSRKSDDSIIKLINGDIKKVESILTFFEKSLDTESSDFNKRKYSVSEIKNEIKSMLTPVFSLNYLEFFLNKIGTKESYSLSEKYINELIDSSINNHFNQSDGLIREKILNEKFNRNDWKYLSAELWLGAMISGRESAFSKLSDKIELKIMKSLAEKNYNISPKDLENIIETASNDMITQTDFDTLIDKAENPLKDSWCWNEKNKAIKSELNDAHTIKRLLKESESDCTLSRIYSYGKEILKIEDFYFKSLQNKYLREINSLKEKKLIRSDDFTPFDNPYFLNIPELPDLADILARIDETRTEYIKEFNTDISQNSITELQNKFSSIITASISKTESAFVNEENLLNDINRQFIDAAGKIQEAEDTDRKSENDDDNYHIEMTPVNKAEFDKAKKIFIKQTELLYEYVRLNLKFLDVTSEFKAVNTDTDFTDITGRIKRNREYIHTLKNIALDCTGLERLIAPSFHKRYHSVCIRISNLLNFINYSLNTEAGKQKNRNPEKINEISEQKKIIKNEITSSREKINNVYMSMIKSLETKRRKLKAVKHEIKDVLVNTELELLADSLDNYLNAYKRQDYTGKALKKYAEKYNELLESVESGTENKSLDHAIRSKSIFPVVHNFSSEKIKHESITKNYLKNSIYKRISSIQTLVTFYKRKGIKINYRPDDLIENAKTKLRIKTDIPLGGWRMTETNFWNIDKKAVQKLLYILKRKIWQNADNRNDLHNKIKINDFRITLSIPEGWIEQKVSSTDSDNGVIRTFRSIDGNSTIYIASYNNTNSVRDASKYWINGMNSRKVAQKWGEKDTSDYYWTLSNHTEGVMESYAISCKQKILIVSGISSKDKYNFFKKKINSVFQSISSI
ncbi:MAG: hypothetical protein JW864_01355 [Spirochaetes bacterium]|nr:hypothetical protein [Spirochaetota bacterium]